MKKFYEKLSKNPPILLGISFVFVILLGAVLLTLPISTKNGEGVSFVDALFTASSATAVTGLTTLNTQLTWSAFGNVVIISLIQIGGLGTMTIFSIGVVLLGKKVSLQQRLIIREQLNISSMKGIVRWLLYVTKITFLIEFIGTSLLSLALVPMYGLKKGILFSLFHSISAFCNAGFDLFGDSLAPFYNNYYVSLIICFLVILGGLGFLVFLDIYETRNFKYLKLHSKVVIIFSIGLLIFGTIITLVLEWTNKDTIALMNFPQKILASFFQSTVTRTAGFYSVDIGKVHDATAFLYIILMFIGGSPASTAGGLKTTTFAILIFSTYFTLKGEKETVVFKRNISRQTVIRALTVVIVSLGVVIIVALTITIIETDRFKFLDILFETVSAFGTVGMSRGITSDLSTASKLIISFTMFTGRVGPATLAMGLLKTKKTSIKYPEGNILVG